MKTLFIKSKLKNLKLALTKQEIVKLPKKLIICYSIQYKELTESIKKQLSSNNIAVNGLYQVLGCSKISNKSDLPILYIGTGRFHSYNLYLQAPELYMMDIANNIINKVPEKEIEKLKNRKRTALLKFLNADNIGILVSTKPGQENIEIAEKLKQKLENKGKKAFVFLSNNIDINQFENFNIDSWINTACPGLSLDSPNIINYKEFSEI